MGSRSLLLPKGNTLSGLEDPSWLLSPPSNRCGSPSRSTMSLAPPSSTGSASKPTTPSRPPTSSPPPSTSAFLNYLTHKTNIPWNILHFWISFLFLINRVFIQILIFSNGRNEKEKIFPDFVSQISFQIFPPSSHQKNTLDSK